MFNKCHVSDVLIKEKTIFFITKKLCLEWLSSDNIAVLSIQPPIVYTLPMHFHIFSLPNFSSHCEEQQKADLERSETEPGRLN